MVPSYVQKLYSVRYSLVLFVLLQTFDTLSTQLALAVGGREGNPVVEAGIRIGGFGLVFAAKQAVILLVFLAIALDPMERPYIRSVLIIMNIVYGIVIAGNFYVFGRYGGTWALAIAYWALAVAVTVVALDALRNSRHRRLAWQQS